MCLDKVRLHGAVGTDCYSSRQRCRARDRAARRSRGPLVKAITRICSSAEVNRRIIVYRSSSRRTNGASRASCYCHIVGLNEICRYTAIARDLYSGRSAGSIVYEARRARRPPPVEAVTGFGSGCNRIGGTLVNGLVAIRRRCSAICWIRANSKGVSLHEVCRYSAGAVNRHRRIRGGRICNSTTGT